MPDGDNCPKCGHPLGYRETISTQTREVQQRTLVCPASGCGFEIDDMTAGVDRAVEIA
jgi:uncharacterized protein YbaR (Trm112 family)